MEFLDLLSLYPWKSGENKAPPPWRSYKIGAVYYNTHWKFQGQKLGNSGNSTSFLLDSWNFHMLSRQYHCHWKFHGLNLHCLEFFWEELKWLENITFLKLIFSSKELSSHFKSTLKTSFCPLAS